MVAFYNLSTISLTIIILTFVSSLKSLQAVELFLIDCHSVAGTLVTTFYVFGMCDGNDGNRKEDKKNDITALWLFLNSLSVFGGYQ